MATHANTAQSMGIKCMKAGGGPAHQCSHTFQVLGVGHIQENPRSSTWFQVVPIVSTSMENGNACQHSLEHENKIERGGTCTPVQPYVSGTRGRGHPGESEGRIGSRRF